MTQTDMIVTIPAGILVISLLYQLLYRLTPLNARQAGFVVSLLVMALYFPVALLYWPGADVLAMNVTVFFMVTYMMGMFFSHRERQESDGGRGGKWFHWGPAIIIGFFSIILIVDGIFVTLSKEGLPGALQAVVLPDGQGSRNVKTLFPGVSYNHYHKKETLYNQYLRQQEEMLRRGWRIRQGWLKKTPVINETAVFQFVIVDKKGQKISGLTVKGRFMRASDSHYDKAFTMKENKSGIYQAEISLPLIGLWNLNLDVFDKKVHFEIHGSTTIGG